MIYITGDTHIPVDIQKLSTKRFPEQKEMTKSDYVIICGDFGGVWDGSNEENTLKKNDLNFDYIITHSAPTSVQTEIASTYEINKLTEFLEKIKNNVDCKKWFFGHYHQDKCIAEKYIAIFNTIYKI